MLSRQERAKQFLAFDALKGFEEALKIKELENEKKKNLETDALEQLEESFNMVEIGDKIQIKWHNGKRYVDISGVLTNIDYIKKKIVLDNKQNINIADILEINKCIY